MRYAKFGEDHYFTDYDGIELEVNVNAVRGRVFMRIRDNDGPCADLIMLNDEQVEKLIEILQNRSV